MKCVRRPYGTGAPLALATVNLDGKPQPADLTADKPGPGWETVHKGGRPPRPARLL